MRGNILVTVISMYNLLGITFNLDIGQNDEVCFKLIEIFKNSTQNAIDPNTKTLGDPEVGPYQLFLFPDVVLRV